MRTTSVLMLLLSLAPWSGAGLDAQSHSSVDAAHQLVRALEERHLDTIAAVEPTEPGTFVAAMYIAGGQLLVVSARHPAIDGVAHRLRQREYRDVYLDLQATPTPRHKFFVQDAGANGFLSVRGSAEVDVLYEDGEHQTTFNGDARSQHLSSAEYEAKLAAADQRYAAILALLTAAVQDLPVATNGSTK